ncbi:MAG: thiolase C-terminal domain-containing protein [Armatimonadota bacterium]
MAGVPDQSLRDRTAISGIGWTAFSRASGTTVANLAAEASLNAIRDSGLTPRDIDGIITYRYFDDTIAPSDLMQALGITQCAFQAMDGLGGGWSCAAVLLAAMTVHTGICRHVLVFRAMNGRSEVHAIRQNRPLRPIRAGQFTAPFGAAHAAATLGHLATAHMARYGTTTLDFAHLAVAQRRHAMLNQKAVTRKPMTIEDHQSSPWIIYPFRLLDCCQETDNAVALVVTSAERARDLRAAPVYITAGVGGSNQPASLWESNGVHAAPAVYRAAGIGPNDLNFAQLYDPFTFLCMLHMEDFGLCEKGGVGAWVRAGQNGLDGPMPVNTHGGLLSEAYVHGLNHVVEAVQQLRPGGVVDDLCEGSHTFDRSRCRQVRDAEVGLVCAEVGGSALILRKA